MQRTIAIAAGFAFLAASLATEAASEIHFNAPGAFSARQTSSFGGEWLLLIFDGANGPASFDLPVVLPTTVENRTWMYPIYAQNRSTQIDPQAVAMHSNRTISGDSIIHLEMQAPSSLYIEAKQIAFSTDGLSGKISERPSAASTKDFLRFNDIREKTQQNHNPVGEHAVLQYEPAQGAGFQVEVDGAQHIEWHGARTSCTNSDWCPDGGPRTSQRLGTFKDLNITSEQFSYQYVERGVPELKGTGNFAYAVVGGTKLHFALSDGSLRLPLATATSACSACMTPRNQTLTATGDFDLTGLHRTGKAALAVNLGGELATAKLDETDIDPAALMGIGAAAGVAAALGLVLLKVLGVLFTKWRDQDLLDQPRRRFIFEAIAEHPGVGFRELTRLTSLPIGTLRHHLDVLIRHGKIVEKEQGQMLRYFENHGKYERTWSRVAVLRDQPSRLVHDWLAEHPQAPQNAILDAMEQMGISRTATHRRLQRLAKAGLVAIEHRGRFKCYRAV